MKKQVLKFLEFNGKIIYFIAKDGQYWIAIKPILEALGVEYTRQFKNLKKDKILGAALAVQPTQVEGDQPRNYACLPEFFLYGWLFQIQSQSEDLLKYKWECYQVLYEHFHGTIGGRKDLLKEKARAQIEIDNVRNSMTTEQALALDKANKRIYAINGRLRQLDQDALEEEKTLFDT